MKKITMLCSLFLLLFASLASAQVTIGEGDDQTANGPFEPYYGYTYAQTIYTAQEINATGSITSLTWSYSGTSLLPNSQQMVVYLGHTTKNSFANNTDWESSTVLTQVYSGGITVTPPVAPATSSQVTITFTTPFAYNGTDNLIVAVEDNMAGYDSSADDFLNTAVSSYRTICYYSDSTNPTITSPPTANSLKALIPNIVLGGITQVCPNPTAGTSTSITTTSATLGWSQVGTAALWNVQYMPVGTALGSGTIINGVATNPLNVTGLTPSTLYQFYVQANCGTGVTSGWVGPYFFNTSCGVVTEFYQGFNNTGTALPDCYLKVGTTGTVNVSTNNGVTGNGLYMYSSSITNQGVFKTADVSNLGAGTHRLRFSLRSSSTTVGGVLHVGYLTDPLDPSTFVLLDEFSAPYANPANSAWQTFIFTPDAGTYSNHLALRHKGDPTTSFYVDDMYWEPIPSCVEPTFFAVDYTTPSSTALNLTWAATGSNFEIEYGPTGFVPGTGTVVTGVTASPYTLSGLTAATTYDIYIKTDCSSGGTSAYSLLTGPLSATTECDFVTSFYEDFESSPSATIFPTCWAKVGTQGSASINTTNGVAGSKGLYMFSSSTTNQAVVKSVGVSNLGAGTHRLRFKLRSSSTTTGGVLHIGYLTDPLDPSTFVLLDEYAAPFANPANSAYQTFIFTPDAGTYSNHLAFRHKGDPTASFYLDEVYWETIPSCVEPTTFAALNATSSSVDFSWIASGTNFTIEYGAPGFTPGTGTSVSNITGSPYTLTGLDPATTYDFYINTVCGTDSSLITGPVTAQTACVAVTEFFEDFESSTGVNVFPVCWGKVGTQGSASINTTNGLNGSKGLYMFSSSTTNQAVVNTIPVSNLGAGTHRLRFSLRSSSTTTGGVLHVGYLTDAADPSTFVLLDEFAAPFASPASSAYETFVFVPDAGTYSDNLAFRHKGDPTTSFYIDEVNWELLPTCTEPSDVIADSISDDELVISWTAPTTAPADGYVYYYSTMNTAPDASTVPSGTVAAGTTTATISGLTPSTTYYVWVQSVCDATSSSIWTSGGSFETECVTYAVPALEVFSTFLPDVCWKEATGGDLISGPASIGSALWGADGFANNGFSGAARINIFTTGKNDWLLSPKYSITDIGYELKFNVAATQYSQTGPLTTPWEADDFVEVLVSTGLNNWTILDTFNDTNVPTNAGQVENYDLSIYNGQEVRFAFRAVEGATNGGADLDFFIDNFEIRLVPTAPPACSANVTAVPDAACGNEATVISWDSSVGADGYYLTIGTTAGGSDVLDNEDVGSALSYDFVGTAGTTYYYSVAPFNIVGAATCSEMSFTTFATGCACTPVYTTGTSFGDLISNVVIVGTTLSNPTGSSTSGPSYTYYQGQPNYTATLQAGETYTLSVSTGSFGSQNMAVWIDYNDDLSFDASEKVGYTTTSIGGNSTGSFQITLDCNPPVGTHIMRVRDVYATSGNLIDPCISYSYGETEDYDVTVINPVACPAPSALMVDMMTTDSATLSWDAGCAEVIWDVYTVVAGSAAPDGTTTATGAGVVSPLVVTGLLPDVEYEFYVRADCDTNGESTWAGPYAFSTLATPPANDACSGATALVNGAVFADQEVVGTNLGATNGNAPAPGCGDYVGGEVWYQVTVPASGNLTIETNSNSDVITDTAMAVYSGDCTGLTLVQCDDDSSADGSFSMISLTNLTAGDVLYVAVWSYNNEEVGSFKISSYDSSLSSISFDNDSFSAYPNPVTDYLTVKNSTDISSVAVVNLLGQTVITKQLNATEGSIDMSSLTQGAYIVNVTVGDVTKSIKVIKN